MICVRKKMISVGKKDDLCSKKYELCKEERNMTCVYSRAGKNLRFLKKDLGF